MGRLHDDSPRSVYFIRPIGMDGPIKIGCTASPDGRRKTLEVWSPFPLEIAAELIGGGFNLERRFHAKFLHLHRSHEWFTAAPELLQVMAEINAGMFDVSSLPPPIKPGALYAREIETRAVKRRGDNPRRPETEFMAFRAFRKRKGWSLDEAGDHLGLSGSTVAKHEAGKVMPTVEVIGRYERLTGGRITAADFVAARLQFQRRREPA